MDANIVTGVVAALALLGLNAVVSTARLALAAAHTGRLRQMAEEGQRGAARALALAENPAHTVVVFQLATITLHLIAAAVVVLTIAPPMRIGLANLGMDFALAGLLAYAIVIVIGAVVALLFTELAPAKFVARDAEAVACILTVTLEAPLRLLRPLASLLLWLSRLVVPAEDVEARAGAFTEEDILTLVSAGEEEGVIEEEERVMISSIFQFGDTLVREVMVPRIDIVALATDAPLDAALDAIIQAGHSRIPVYQGSIDHIRGILYAKDLLNIWREGHERPIADLLRPAYFIPEAKRAVDLLAELQSRKVHIAIVVDEYGGTAGLVTIEDLIEEIVGEIQDEYDINEEATFERLSDTEFIFDARIDLDDFNELFHSHLSTETGDTLGGFIFSVLGRVPQENERFNVDQLEIEILSVTGRRIRKVRVKRLPVPQEGDPREDVTVAPD